MFTRARDAARLARDAQAEHDFTKALIAELKRDNERAEHEKNVALAALAALKNARGGGDDSVTSMSAGGGDARGARRGEDGDYDDASGSLCARRDEALDTRTSSNEAHVRALCDAHEKEMDGIRAQLAAVVKSEALLKEQLNAATRASATREASFERERATLLEELEEMREQFRSATASAHKANAEVNALAHQSRAKLEKERRRGDAAEAKLKAMSSAAASVESDSRVEDAIAALSRAQEEIVALRCANEELETRVQDASTRGTTMEDDARREYEIAIEEKERALAGLTYADEAAVSLRRAALNAQTMASAFRARLYPDGDPEIDQGRALTIVAASLAGHPFEDANRDVTRAIRSRLARHNGKRLVILVSETLSDLVPDDVVDSIKSSQESGASLRIVYAFDTFDSNTGERIRGDEKVITIPIGAACTAHAFAMQSVWIESAPTGIEDALKAAYSRLRDAEAAASNAKTRAIALQVECIKLRHQNGSAQRAFELDAREHALLERQAELDAQTLELEVVLARARAENERVNRDASRLVSDASAKLRVAEDEIARLHATERARALASTRAAEWRRDEGRLRDNRRRQSTSRARERSKDALDSIAAAESRLARITAACANREHPARRALEDANA